MARYGQRGTEFNGFSEVLPSRKLYGPCLCGILWRHHCLGLILCRLGGRTQRGLSEQILGLSMQHNFLQGMGKTL